MRTNDVFPNLVVAAIVIYCLTWIVDRTALSTVTTYQTTIEDVRSECRQVLSSGSGPPRLYTMITVKIPEEDGYLDYQVDGVFWRVERPPVGAKVAVTVLEGRLVVPTELLRLERL